MFYVYAFSKILYDKLDHASLLEPVEGVSSPEEHSAQVSLKNRIFQESLNSAWGVIFLSALPWGSKHRSWRPEGAEFIKIEWFEEFGKMRAYLIALANHWEEITSLGQNYYGSGYSRDYFWWATTTFNHAFAHLGVPDDRVEATFGRFEFKTNDDARAVVPRAEFQALVDEALENSKDFPEIGPAVTRSTQ